VKNTACTIKEHSLGRGARALTMGNEDIAVTFLPDKGADVYSLVYKPKRIDILWKSPWGLRGLGKGFQTSFDSEGLWMENYPGGWQMIFPNGGNACLHKGVELNFHGEASTIGWDTKIIEEGNSRAEIEFSTRLYKSPFRIVRRVAMESGGDAITIQETITNEAGAPMDCMWGHHPAFGAPFLSNGCRIRTGAGNFIADESCSLPHCPLLPGKISPWPFAAGDDGVVDLSLIPDQKDKRYIMGYLEEFDEGWYEIENSQLGLTFGLKWDKKIFPFAWFWQEMNAGGEYPWYGKSYVAAIEPFSSYPGYGLNRVIEETETQLRFEPGETKKTEITGYFRL
jgi:galactose mutarotase-like enzyme